MLLVFAFVYFMDYLIWASPLLLTRASLLSKPLPMPVLPTLRCGSPGITSSGEVVILG